MKINSVFTAKEFLALFPDNSFWGYSFTAYWGMASLALLVLGIFGEGHELLNFVLIFPTFFMAVWFRLWQARRRDLKMESAKTEEVEESLFCVVLFLAISLALAQIAWLVALAKLLVTYFNGHLDMDLAMLVTSITVMGAVGLVIEVYISLRQGYWVTSVA